MKIQKITITLAAVVAIAGCKGKEKVENIALQPVKTCYAVSASAADCVQYPGKVVSDDKAYTAFKVAGRIASIDVKEGDVVKPGQVIGSLDRTDYLVALDAVEAEYNSVNSEAQRIIALYQENATTQIAYDKAVYGLQQISAKLRNARNQLNDTKLTAPTGGVVKSVLRHAGEVVGAGMPVIEIVDDKVPLVEIKIPASTFSELGKYRDCYCRFDAYPDQTFPLKLSASQSIANANQLYTVKFTFADAPATHPAIGMSTTVVLCGGADEAQASADTWIVPATALTGNGGDSYIYIVKPDSVLQLTQVTVTRLTGDGDAEIKSSTPLDRIKIVAAGAGKLTDRAKVRPLEPASPTNIGNQL